MSKERVYIFDTTLRDGEQVPGCQLNATQKVEIATQLEELGVDIIEAGFPVSSPEDFRAVDLLSRTIRESSICGLSRAVQKDIEIAGAALKHARRPRIHTGIGTSDVHIKYKFNSTREEILARAIQAVTWAKNYADDVEFYAEDAGRTDNAFLAKVVEAVIGAGATVVNIPDTTGYCMPEEYGAKIRYLKEHVANIDRAIISAHCHNDLGLATANSICAVQNGARQIECTINGIGERAGNTALEEVVMILSKRKTAFYTEIKTELLCETSRLVEDRMNMPVQAHKAIVGDNAFAHSSGIHQDGVIKSRINYEIIDPSEVGAGGSKIVLTARSGRAALAFKARKLGVTLEGTQLDEKYHKFLELADRLQNVTEDDLRTLLEQPVVV